MIPGQELRSHKPHNAGKQTNKTKTELIRERHCLKKKKKKQATDLEKLFAEHISNNGFVYKLDKEWLKLNKIIFVQSVGKSPTICNPVDFNNKTTQ